MPTPGLLIVHCVKQTSERLPAMLLMLAHADLTKIGEHLLIIIIIIQIIINNNENANDIDAFQLMMS